MATATHKCDRDREIVIDLPNEREYEDPEAAELDKALVETIRRAEDADNNYLARLLRNELVSLYYGSEIGL